MMILFVYTITTLNTAIAQCNTGTSISTNTINTNVTIGSGGGVFNNNGQDITINAGATLIIYRCTFLMSGGSKIIVKKRGKLKLDNCHIYACTSMWQGIEVEAGGSIDISSLDGIANIIEDARIAINYTFPLVADLATLAPAKLMVVDNVIFNRNEIGINFNGTTNFLPANPNISYINTAIEIGNCVFTCRSLPVIDATNATGYDAGFFIGSLKASTASSATIFPNTPNVYTQPYINNTNFPDNTTGAFLKLPFAANTAKSKTGIYINNFLGGASGVTIGYINGSAANDKLTLFDNHDIGIRSIGSQIKVQNCSFQKPNLERTSGTNASTKGYGVYMSDTWTSSNFGGNQIGNENDYNNNSNSYKKNGFFDLNTAIYFDGYGDMGSIFYNDIRSTQSITDTSHYRGRWGIRFELSSSGSANMDIAENNIHNIRNGIIYNNLGAYNVGTSILTVNSNTIGNNISPSNVLPNSYVRNAIRATSNQLTTYYNLANIAISIQQNHLKNVYNGIFASGWINKAIEAYNNDINMATDPDPLNNIAYGIRFEGGVGIANAGSSTYTNSIIMNTVTGSSLTKEQAGISIAGQTFTNVGCNTVTNAKYGYRMVGNSNPTQFWDNTISPTNLYGFALTDGGVIGKIGIQTFVGSIPKVQCTSDNDWLVTNANMPTGHFKTYVGANTIAANSPFIVNNSPTKNPMGSGFGSASSQFYSTTNGSIIPGISSGPCVRCVPLGPIVPIGISSENPMTIDAPGLEDIADGELVLGDENTTTDPDVQLMAMQQQLYDALQNPSPQLGINQTLQDFITQNNWGSFQYIYFTRKFLAEGNLVYAQSLLNSWYGNTTLDQNYYHYFNWLLLMRLTPSYAPPIANVLAMANLCPATAGNVVYAAQNLYNTLTGDITYFSDECTTSSNTSARGVKRSNKKEVLVSNINIFPNPSNGEINISFNKADAGLKQFTITDIYGKSVWQQQSSFSSGILKANLNVANGIYFLNINNNKNNTRYVQKIVINK